MVSAGLQQYANGPITHTSHLVMLVSPRGVLYCSARFMHAYSGTGVTTVLYPLSDMPSGRVMRPSSSGGARAVRPGAVEPLRPELPVAAPAHVVHLVVREAVGRPAPVRLPAPLWVADLLIIFRYA